MTRTASTIEVRRAESATDAAEQLASLGPDGAILAGGTWTMRGRLRGEAMKQVYVTIDRASDLKAIRRDDEALTIGAGVTHETLSHLSGDTAIACLRQAGRKGAFPAIRTVATIGGNVGAVGFAEADLVPALLAADASVLITAAGRAFSTPLAELRRDGGALEHGLVLTEFTLPTPNSRRSAFHRLTVRGGGEYAVASVAVSLDMAVDGTVEDARVAVGAVEEHARLCPEAAAALRGGSIAERAGEAARALAAEIVPRTELAVPEWYRRAVIGPLLHRALEELRPEGAS